MNTSSNSTARKSTPSLIRLSSMVIILAAMAVLWVSQSRTKDRLDRLSVENNLLKDQLTDARRKIDQLNSGDSSDEARERLAAARETAAPQAPSPETETFYLEEPAIVPTETGIAVRLRFIPDEGIALPSEITLVSRVSSSGSARILSLNSSSSSEGAGSIVNSAGNLAIIQIAPDASGSLDLLLTISEPTKATVRGSEGILDFELDITSTECSVRKL